MRIFGFIGNIASFIVNLLLLPLSIYGLMQIMGWDWVKAGVAALIVSVLPFFGSVGNLLLAACGVYFVIINWPNLW
jgi:hypothetical protein